MFWRRWFWLMIGLILLTACIRPASSAVFPGGTESDLIPLFVPTPLSTATPSFRMPSTRVPGAPMLTPTPDLPHSLPTQRSGPEQYLVQYGDTLGEIAAYYEVSVESILEANSLDDPNILEVGQLLVIPMPTPQPGGSAFKIIPDSELVYGPMSTTLDIEKFVNDRGGYLSSYAEEVEGEILSGAGIVLRVAQYYSVNPRLLLAILEYLSGWVGDVNPDPLTLQYPLDFLDEYHAGLYRQLNWAADTLNRGYYLWRADAVGHWVLADGSMLPVDATINAGTAALQHFFAQLDDYETWQHDVSLEGFFSMYFLMFGYPFDLSVEPLVPVDLVQPPLQLPFPAGEIWAFTGGPHGGWDSGSAWAALDFAPPGEAQGCVISDTWVTAMADGLILRSADGAVIQDLDNDGNEQTGWVIFYMHIESRDNVQAGMFLRRGERIGHPSCEGGFSNGTHVHVARRFNGEWIPTVGSVPFVLSGWIASEGGVEYDGYLQRGDLIVEAYDGNSPANQIKH